LGKEDFSMTEMMSFTKYEHDSIPLFRERINKAESIDDVRRVFSRTIRLLLKSVLSEETEWMDEDVVLKPHGQDAFVVGDRLLSSKAFKAVWDKSDLARVMSRFAESAARRYRHLEKKPEKTDAKIRM
jgi:hypothetical protein